MLRWRQLEFQTLSRSPPVMLRWRLLEAHALRRSPPVQNGALVAEKQRHITSRRCAGGYSTA